MATHKRTVSHTPVSSNRGESSAHTAGPSYPKNREHTHDRDSSDDTYIYPYMEPDGEGEAEGGPRSAEAFQMFVHVVEKDPPVSWKSKKRRIIAIQDAWIHLTQSQIAHVCAGGYFRLVLRRVKNYHCYTVDFWIYYIGGEIPDGDVRRFKETFIQQDFMMEYLPFGTYLELIPGPGVVERLREHRSEEEEMVEPPSKKAKIAPGTSQGTSTTERLASASEKLETLSAEVASMQTLISTAETRYREVLSINHNLATNIDELKSTLTDAISARDSANEQARISAALTEKISQELAASKGQLDNNAMRFRERLECVEHQLQGLRSENEELQRVRAMQDAELQEKKKKAHGETLAACKVEGR